MTDDWKLSITKITPEFSITLHSQEQTIEEIRRLKALIEDGKSNDEVLDDAFPETKVYPKPENGKEVIPVCEVHNVPMVKRTGKYGEFWGCPTYAVTKCTFRPGVGF